jgi:hypothetical protein
MKYDALRWALVNKHGMYYTGNYWYAELKYAHLFSTKDEAKKRNPEKYRLNVVRVELNVG